VGQVASVELLENRRLLASSGLQSVYYDDLNFVGASVARVDRAIDMNWGTGKPVSSIGADTFSVRWTGRLKATTSENYRLFLVSESAVRLWIGDRLVIDGWKPTSKPTNYKGNIDLLANRRYDVQIELAHNTGAASVKFHWQTDTLVKQTVPSKLMTPQAASLQSKINHAMAFARDRVSRTLADFPTPAKAGYPEQTDANGKWIMKDAAGWTAGYFGGQMWQLDKYFAGTGWEAKATTWTLPLATESDQPGDHFSRLWNTFKPLYDKTGNPAHRQVLLDAAASKDAQFSTKIGGFRTPEIVSNSGSPKANFGLLMDQTLDMDLLFWASEQTGDARFRDHAIRHVETIIARMVRPDGSVFQRFFFDGATGQAIGGENYQGHSNTSVWARGQAWAVYGLSRVAELSGRPDFLAAARKVADYFVSHLPADFVPYWDFAAPGIPNTYRDTSAAAIAARGLLRLGKFTGDASYTAAATSILGSLLTSKYLAEGTNNRGILQHAALHVPKNRGADCSLVFADYYVLEAINAYTSKT
jgi:unsaturated chondroitin disaccharide hydrolase